MNTTLKNKNGFTLIEILVAMAVGMTVMYMIYTFFYLQQKTYINQSEITAIQQDIVGAMHIMERDIRLAGYDATGEAKSGYVKPGFLTPDSTDAIKFSADLTGDEDLNDTGEILSYSLVGSSIVRTDESDLSNPGVLISGVDAFDIRYLDKDGNSTSSLSDIRSVQITIVVRTGRADYNYTNSESYYPNNDTTATPIYNAPNDNFRRRVMATQILCRNMGLSPKATGSVIPS
ncbi:prepilin-type N-terminal cleavage/methylation domain-containing protein [Desulfococcaceae bacterium HSG7]|nr:prepilin-type N-terminal cleavage/methylation domain-containing protein [Desulfococcaceae bacterium HSG7]